MTDREVLAHSLKLGDAQEVVARQYGFESWQALKEGLSTMANLAAQTPTNAVIIAVGPELFVADIQASLDFFTHKLGFSIVFTYGEPPILCTSEAGRGAAQFKVRRQSRAQSRT